MIESMDRHARQDARAKEVIERERARQEKRKNSLPPFLMVRSGLLNNWIWALGLGAGLACSILKEHEFINGGLGKWTTVFGVLFAIAMYYGAIKTDLKRDGMKNDIKTIQKEFYLYMKNNNYVLDFSKEIQNKKLMRILIEHIVKYDDGIFDKMVENPASVDDFDARNAIIGGELKVRPDHAQNVIESFNQQDISFKLYKKAQKYTERLRNSEKMK